MDKKKLKQRDESRDLLLPQYNEYDEQQYEQNVNYPNNNNNNNNINVGPSNYGTTSGSYLDNNNNNSQNRDQNLTPRQAWIEFFTKGALALVLLIFILIGCLKFMRLHDLQQELSKVPNIRIDDFFVEGFSDRGVDVRVVGATTVDYKVVDGTVRRGVVRGVAKVLDSLTLSDSNLKVYFEEGKGEYARAVDATMPDMKVKVAHNSTTDFDFVTTLSDFGSAHVMVNIVKRLLSSEPLKFKGVAQFGIRKGMVYFGNFPIVVKQTLNKQDGSLSVTLGDISLENIKDGVAVSTIASTNYQYPIEAEIPSLKWDIKIPGCQNGKRELLVSTGKTSNIHLEPYSVANASISASLSKVPQELLELCGPGEKSPLDTFISNYLGGEENKVIIQGSAGQGEVPSWMNEILSQFKFEYKLDGKTTEDDLIKDLRFDDFNLQIPDGRNAKVSAAVKVTVSPPNSIQVDENIPLKVAQARGVADLYSQNVNFAQVVIDEWVPCTTHVVDHDYIVGFQLKDVPVIVKDRNLFSQVVQSILFKGSAPVRVESLVDAKVSLPIGEFVLSEIPASGDTDLRRN